MQNPWWLAVSIALALIGGAGCGSSEQGQGGSEDGGTEGVEPPGPACSAAAGGGQVEVAEPELLLTLADRWEEGWLGSPAVADLDGDGAMEIIAPRGAAMIVWGSDGALRWKFEGASGRIWSSPVVADLQGDGQLEVAFAAHEQVFVLDSQGAPVSGFPVSWEVELRSLAAGDIDGDGEFELVAAPAHGGPSDVMHAWNGDGSVVSGFPPNASGSSGCQDQCYLAGCFDQNLAVGDLDGDGKHDIVSAHDNAYASIHSGTGAAFDSAEGFPAPKTPGVRYLHDLAEAQQGWAPDEDTALQAHFTNTPPAIADLDGDDLPEVIMLASVQNAAQSDREQGVALWVVGHDASRMAGWEEPFHAPDYLSGLWDYGDNIVAITNQVTVADIDPDRPGPEMLFAGFDGRIHAVAADRQAMWSVRYTDRADVGTGGILVADLSGDGAPEVIFASYSSGEGDASLFILDAGGNRLHTVALPRRGAMPVPTIADVDGNGELEIVVSLKDAADQVESVLVYTVPGSAANCLPWPTGRANLLRNAWVTG
jgi:hypothetical protein